jgi:iron complex outermembrane receptor protein
MKNKTTYAAFILSASFTIQAETLTGTLFDKDIKLTQAKLIIPALKRSTTSDANGVFKFEDLDFGKYLLDIEVSNNAHYNIDINFKDSQPILINVSNINYEEVVVTANPLEHNSLKMTTPTAVLSEEELIMNRSTSIEQTLNKVTGVNSGSFGIGAGQIVIRGQQGPRISVLNNNISLQDASNVSPDHWVSSESLLAKQIEVLKGPATLLYGGGAVGGVVNVLDNTIPTQDIEGLQGGVELRFSDSSLSERTGVLSLEGGLTENLMSHFSYINSETSDYEIPGFAESNNLHESEEGSEERSPEELLGILENTSLQSEGYNLGLSLINDNGFWGVSYSKFDRNYGIPGHEEHHEDHENKNSDEEEEEEIVRIVVDKSVFNIRGSHQFYDDNFFKLFKTHFSQTKYQHIEQEGEEIGTVFNNKAHEFRFELTHGSIAGFSGVWGLQQTSRDFSALGDEAFIIPSKTNILSAFLIEEHEFENWHGEFGLRFDNQKIETTQFSTLKETAFSLSLGATIDISENWTLPINYTSAQRLPTAEELFSNLSGAEELIPHLATSTIEIGNTQLKHETANNFDLGLRYRSKNIGFNFALFHNRIDDYIFLEDSGDRLDDIPVFLYQQKQATFKGFEADFSYQINDKFNNNWNYRLFTDRTKASLQNGDNVPRIPASRLGMNIDWLRGNTTINLDFIHVQKQDNISEFELPTNSYNDVSIGANWIIKHNKSESLFFLKINNLLDEEIR